MTRVMGMFRTIATLSCLIIGFTFVSDAVRLSEAQVLYGSIVGTLTDETGAVIPKAVVTVTHTATGLARQATTDTAGYYSIPNLQEGTYELSVSAGGFKPYTQRGISVPINAVTRVDATIQVGALAENITVDAPRAILQTAKADVSVNLDARAIQNVPLSNYRNYQSLINLVPGATPARFQNAVTDTPGRALSANVNGQERGANNTRVDGSADILVTMPHHAVYVPPIESIQEVNIATNNFDSEQGMTGGAAITVITKSGTNDFRGSAFALHDNSRMRAFLWDENRAGVTEKPSGNRNIDGGSIGGPIRRNKVFFFTDWEGTFERVNRSRLSSVPTADFRRGDFSRMLGGQILSASGSPIMVPTTEGGFTALREGMIFDPYSGNLDGTGRAVFSNAGQLNTIPQARLNGPTTRLLNLAPLPNLAGDTNNYFNSGTQRLNRNNFDAKINWNRNERHQLWFKYSMMDALVHGAFSLGEAGGDCLCDGGNGDGDTLVQLAGIGHTYTVAPNFLIDGTFGWTRFGQAVLPPDLGTNFGSDVLGIPGTNGPDPRESGMPPFYIAGFSPLGNPEGWSPLYRNDQSYTFNTNASWMKGTHDVRFGFDFVHHLMNHWQPELGEGPRGAFYFNPGVTALNPEALDASVGFLGETPSFENDWNAVAAYLLGTPDVSGKSSQFIKMNSFENQYALYVRDRWRVTPKLTLDLGLRWELYPNRTRSGGLGIESYDPTTNEALIGGRGNVPQDNGVGFSKKLFAPRVGFAYQITSSTVIRSGYGISYHSHPWGAQALRGWYPLTVAAVFTGVNGFQPVTTGAGYVAAGVPNAPLGPNVGIPSICCPDISTGTGAAAGRRRDRLSARQRGAAQGLHPVVEPDPRAPPPLRSRRLPRLRRHGVGEWLRVPRHQRVADSGLGRRRASAVRGVRTDDRDARMERPHAQHVSLAAVDAQPAVHEGPAAEGGVHVLEGDRRSRLLRLDGVPMERVECVLAQSRARLARHSTQPADGVRVRAAVRRRQEVADERHQQHAPGRLAAQWDIRRVSGPAVHADRIRLVAEHAGQSADARSDQGQRRRVRARRR